MITKGRYAEYRVLMVIPESETVAERWAADYNATFPWTCEDDKAVVEPVDFTPVGLRPRPSGHRPAVIDVDQPLVIDGN
jgi:hypothetical protein